jgi:hypothetical protein
LENVGVKVEGGDVYKLILQKFGITEYPALKRPRMGSNGGLVFCEYGYEPSDSIQSGNF